MRNALLRTIVVAFRTLGYLETTSLAVASKVGFRGRIDEIHAVNIHEIIVEANRQRIGNSHETTLTIGFHVILLTANIDDNLASFRSLNTEIGTALLVNLREFVAGNSVLNSYCIGGHHNLLSYRHVLRTLRLETELASYSLTITATQLTIACSIKMQAVRTV